ncbi:MAG TPA: hypothetical protein VGT05_02380 [Patescibacteria group bacterium]|nr:hypothetical protein [Patescibacteria group bacterium]
MYYSVPWWKKLFSVIEFAIGINIILVDVLLAQQLIRKNPNAPFLEQMQNVVQSTPSILTPTPTVVFVPTSTPQPAVSAVTPVVAQVILAKDYYIPFGSGQSTATDWTDVAGLQTYINPANYTHLKQVIFEASIQVPTANETAWVRLYDVTAGHEVWYSDMYFSGGASPQYLISQPVQLGSGNDLYQVQMKTQLGSPANLLQSRIHVTLQ